MCDILKAKTLPQVLLYSHQQRKGVKLMDVGSLFLSSIPSMMDGLKRFAAIIWAEDKTYIIAFILFAFICFFLNSKMKKKHYH